MKAVLVTADSVVETITLPDQGGTAQWDTLVGLTGGDLVERVRMPWAHVVAYVDEEGRVTGRPVNWVGSYLYGYGIHGQTIHGPMVLVGEEPYEGELRPMGDGEFAVVLRQLQETVQIVEDLHRVAGIKDDKS